MKVAMIMDDSFKRRCKDTYERRSYINEATKKMELNVMVDPDTEVRAVLTTPIDDIRKVIESRETLEVEV